MSDRIYAVICKRGRLMVMVRTNTVKMRGERNAVAQAAWLKLMGQDELGQDVDKNLATRKILMDELGSRYEAHRPLVYEQFKENIRFQWIGLART